MDRSLFANPVAAPPRLFFTSNGRTCLINADGTGLRVLEPEAPGQATWQPGSFLPDGRVLLLSMEPRRDGPGRPFEQYYTQTPPIFGPTTSTRAHSRNWRRRSGWRCSIRRNCSCRRGAS